MMQIPIFVVVMGKMICIALLLLANCAAAQPYDPAMVFSQHTRLGMNGHIKTVTAYKYTRLKYRKDREQETRGTIYSVIKNMYDSSGLLTGDSTAMYYNPKQALGFCRSYEYAQQDGKAVILVHTRFDCMPPYDNHAVEESIIELTTPNDSTVQAREYKGSTLAARDKQLISMYRITMRGGLVHRVVFDNYRKGRELSGSSTCAYDSYGNFTETTLKVGEAPAEVIRHKISNIDEHGNALRMLNFSNREEKPGFMTSYEFEYYE